MIDWLESNPVTAVHWVSSPTVPLGDFSSISNPCQLLPKKKKIPCPLKFMLSLSISGGRIMQLQIPWLNKKCAIDLFLL